MVPGYHSFLFRYLTSFFQNIKCIYFLTQGKSPRNERGKLFLKKKAETPPKKERLIKKRKQKFFEKAKKNLRNVRGKVKFFEKEKYHILYKKREIPSKKI